MSDERRGKRQHFSEPATEVPYGARVLLALFIVFLASAPSLCQNPPPTDTLDALVVARQYPVLERSLSYVALSNAESAYYHGLLANHLNRATESVNLLEAVLPTLEANSPLRAEIAVCTLADDFVKLSHYDKASATYDLAAHLAQAESRESFCQAGRESARWALFSDAPAQVVVSGATTMIRGTRDNLGLVQVPVSAGSYSGAWLLDTGANLTVIRRSAADRIGVRLSAVAADAQGSSGKSVAVRAGTIPELRIGKIVIRNVPVLVVEDADLNFPDAGYELEGSLGLPVLEALGKITFFSDGSVVLGPTAVADASAPTHTLFLERSTPLLTADLGHGQELFVIDTGAQGTILSSQFFEQAGGTAQLGSMATLSLAGAGGVGSIAAFGPIQLVARFNDTCVPLTEAHILATGTGSADDFYGVIGQDALRQLSSITLDFQNMTYRTAGGEGCSKTSEAEQGK